MNFVGYLFEKSRYLEKLFILGDHGTFTYTEFVSKLEYLSSGIHYRNGRGKKFLVMADNTPFFIFSYLSVIFSGNIAVLVDTRISKTDLTKVIDTSSPDGACVQDKYRKNFEDSELDIIDETIINKIQEEMSLFNRPFIMNDNDIAVIIFTSGSTGTKKGVMLSHKNLISNTESIIDYLKLSESDRIGAVLPFFYCYGASLLHTHIRVGGSIVLNQKPFLGSMIKDIDTYQCTGFAGVPSTYQILINKTKFLDQEFPTLKYFTQAGGQLPNRYIQLLSKNFPAKKFYVMYGATEATARLSYLPPELLTTKMGSIGKGIPGVTLAVINEKGLPVKPSEIGEIAAKGDNIMKGYYNDSEGTDAVLKNGWLYTGDLATIDDDGFIYIKGRLKNFIKSGGFRVSPNEIEHEILSLEKVSGCAVLGIPEEIMGEAIVAVILVSNTVDHEDLRREILTHCNQRLPSYKVPKKIFFIDEFPLNSSNKTDLFRLKEIVLAMEKSETKPDDYFL
jgi:acyl-CoA synthetase (AMP-forming)/AMP-acid ligase II